MKALIVAGKFLVLLACITALPWWLIFSLGVPVIYAVLGSVVLCIFLAALWMRRSA